MTRLTPLGERAYLARFDSEAQAARWASAVRAESWPGVLDVVLAYDSVGVFADPDRVDLEELAERLERIAPPRVSDRLGKLVRVPVLYDGEDLAEVAEKLGISVDGVVSAHSTHEYRVYAIGFQPGFPYAGFLPRVLQGLPRRSSPRTRVPAGSVAIVGRQTAVYPNESPGGWHLIGRTPLSIVDVEQGRFPLRAGDRLRFMAIDRTEYEARRGEPL